MFKIGGQGEDAEAPDRSRMLLHLLRERAGVNHRSIANILVNIVKVSIVISLLLMFSFVTIVVIIAVISLII